MKNKAIKIVCALILFAITGCDSLPDEQFIKYVLITHNGFQDCVIDNSGTADISVSISGTSKLNKDVEVILEKNTSILDEYNFDKFRYDESLYYLALPDEAYDLGPGKVTINKGEEYAVLPIKIDATKIDKYKQYVLPIAIASTSDYQVSTGESHYVLLRILLENNYSGMYTMTGKVSDNVSGDLSISMNRYLYMFDENVCYFYLGNVEETDVNKANFIGKVEFLSNYELKLTTDNNLLMLTPATPSVENKVNSYEIVYNSESQEPETINIYMKYSYLDMTVPSQPITRNVDTKLVLSLKNK